MNKKYQDIYEVNFNFLIASLIATIILIVVGIFLSVWFHDLSIQDVVVPSKNVADLEMIEPPLLPEPEKELYKVRKEEDAILNSYGWVDRNAKVVRVPIKRAIEIFWELQYNKGDFKGVEEDSEVSN